MNEELTGDIISIDILDGSLNSDQELNGSITDDDDLSGDISETDEISGEIGEAFIPVFGPPYEGDYVVKPSFDNQVLDTDYKLMERDVTVTSIPISITSNLAGGKTVYIG